MKTTTDNIYNLYEYDNFEDFIKKTALFMDTICFDFIKNSTELAKNPSQKNKLFDTFYNNIYVAIKKNHGGENFIKCVCHVFMSEQSKMMIYDIISFFYGDVYNDADIVEKLYNFIFEDDYNTTEIYNELYFNIISDSILNLIYYINNKKTDTGSDELSNHHLNMLRYSNSPSKYDN